MRIIVTGASGFLGSRIAAHYQGRHDVFAPTHAQMDICDGESVRRYFEAAQPDAVVHCAAVSEVGACTREPERSRRINVDGSLNIAQAARRAGAKCVMCSSDQVYAASAVKTPHGEEECVLPAHAYGQQKRTMEEACLGAAPDSVMLRLSWMYDAQKRSAQERDSFITKLLADLRAHRALRFAVYDRRGITDVAEVVRNIERTFAFPGGVYNFGAYNDASMYHTMQDVLARVDWAEKPELLRDETAFAGSPRNLCMDVKKAADLGAAFSTTADGITRALQEAMKAGTI